jgi:hypothetical protein
LRNKNGDGATLHRRRPSGCGQLKLRFFGKGDRRPALLFWVGPPLGNMLSIDSHNLKLHSIPHIPNLGKPTGKASNTLM